jgi:hypothetical protein
MLSSWIGWKFCNGLLSHSTSVSCRKTKITCNLSWWTNHLSSYSRLSEKSNFTHPAFLKNHAKYTSRQHIFFLKKNCVLPNDFGGLERFHPIRIHMKKTVIV